MRQRSAAVVIHLGARQIGLSSAHLRLRIGDAGEILGRMLAGEQEIGLRLLNRQLRIRWIDGGQHLALMHEWVSCIGTLMSVPSMRGVIWAVEAST